MSGMEDLASAFANPPDPHGPVPLSNRVATIYGATLPFHILTWAAVVFRLYTRIRIVRDLGWDDYLIAVSAIFNLLSLIAFYACVPVGLGGHLYFVDPECFVTLFKLLYVQNAAYYTCAGLIKLSLICQYLRIFTKGPMRLTCIVLLVMTGIWSSFWFIQGWFPCFPVSGFWNRAQQPPPKCWGTGFKTVKGALIAFVGFAAGNMTLDMVIFFVPVTLYLKPGIAARQVTALVALFSLGSVVLLMSVLRLWTAVRHAGEHFREALDFTWWYPLTMIISSLEIDFAIICASIPVFWPVVVDSLPHIFVTQEVRVTHHQRLPDGTSGEFELSRTFTSKSSGGDSQENLTKFEENTKTDYNDQFVKNHVTGKMESSTEITGQKQKKRRQT